MKTPSGKVPWENDDVNYPVKHSVCRLCGLEGTMKTAWDFQGDLCREPKACMKRWGKSLRDRGIIVDES